MNDRAKHGLRLLIRWSASVAAALLVRGFLTVGGAAIARWYFLTTAIGVAAVLGTRAELSAIPRAIAIPLASVFLVGMAYLGAPWTSRDRFLLDFERVQVGMARSEVASVMAAYRTGTGISSLPGVRTIHTQGNTLAVDPGASSLSPKGCQVYRHSTDPAWNADWGIVCYRAGRVVSTEFSPD